MSNRGSYRNFIPVLFIFCLAAMISSCSSISYVSHVTGGQIDLLWKRKNIEELLLRDDLSPGLRERLMLTQKVRLFAEESLQLPVGNAYTSYSDLERPYALWNVYAAPALSMESYAWCLPFAGCIAYRGYYEKHLAEKEANRLKVKGLDVKVGGVRAYSTIGYFNDPVLNSFIETDEVYFIELLIHEIAHRKFYVKDDTTFNENFATAVGQIGAELWYTRLNDRQKFENYQVSKKNFKQVVTFLLRYKNQLHRLYQDNDLEKEVKMQRKELIIKNMIEKYEEFKHDNNIDNRYDYWVSTMNNATFSTLANYQELVPNFIALFQQVGQNWQKFYQEVERISELPKKERHQALKMQSLGAENSPPR